MRCTQCGRTNEQNLEEMGCALDVHRLVPGSRYTVDGCVTLCKGCHGPQPKRRPRQPDLAYPDRQRLGVVANDRILAALEGYLLGTVPRVTKTAAVEAALMQFLEREGCWPPKDESASEGGV